MGIVDQSASSKSGLHKGDEVAGVVRAAFCAGENKQPKDPRFSQSTKQRLKKA